LLRIRRPILCSARDVARAGADLTREPEKIEVDLVLLHVPLVVAVQVRFGEELELHVERFSVDRFFEITAKDLNDRIDEFRQLVAFEKEIVG